jgi:hypothetical protein
VFVTAGTAQRLGLQFHHPVGGETDHLPRKVASEPSSSGSRSAILVVRSSCNAGLRGSGCVSTPQPYPTPPRWPRVLAITWDTIESKPGVARDDGSAVTTATAQSRQRFRPPGLRAPARGLQPLLTLAKKLAAKSSQPLLMKTICGCGHPSVPDLLSSLRSGDTPGGGEPRSGRAASLLLHIWLSRAPRTPPIARFLSPGRAFISLHKAYNPTAQAP